MSINDHVPIVADEIMQEKELLEKINTLKNILVPMAEFEYLYDPDKTKEGQIDPNALSAGGFPFFCLSVGLFKNLYLQSQTAEYDKSSPDYIYLFDTLGKYVKDNYKISRPQFDNFVYSLCESVRKIFSNNIDRNLVETLLTELHKHLTSLSTNRGDHNYLLKLFENEFTLANVSSKFWVLHKMKIVNAFYDTINSGGSIGPFDNKLLQLIDHYIDSYVDGMNLNKLTVDKDMDFSDYKVPGEADLGYMLKYKLEKLYPKLHVNVWIDLHSKTGLFSLIPFKAHTSLLSGKKQKEAYAFIRKFEVFEDSNIYLLKSETIDYKLIFDKASKITKLYIDNEQPIVFRDTVNTENTITEEFNQYAYLYEFFPKDKIDWNKPCSKIMYLSSFLNAKAALFRVYELTEQKENIVLQRPHTKITTAKVIDLAECKDLINEDRLVVKEGGKCSTGGSEVVVYNTKISGDFIKTSYKTTVIQSYIPSHIFKYKGNPVHAHCRKLSVIDSRGVPTHVGYNFKITCRQDNANSSAYATIPVMYDEEGKFLYGAIIANTITYFTDLKEVGLELAISEAEFKKFLSRVKLNWLTAIYSLNKFFESNLILASNNIVKDGYVDGIYTIPCN